MVVFVDDAVRDRLPGICVTHGGETEDRLTLNAQVRGTGPLWLLLFLGPVGWVIYFLVSWSSSAGRTLTVVFPACWSCHRRGVVLARWRLGAMVASAAALVGVLYAAGHHAPLASWTFAAVLVAAVGLAARDWWSLRSYLVSVSLDASGRWVGLANVHPDFVAACQSEPSLH